MILSFADQGTEDLYHGRDSREARVACPRSLWPVAWRKLDQVNRARTLEDLRVPPGNRLERLLGSRTGQYSIRVNRQYRVCFRWEEGDAEQVEVADYH